MTPQHLHPSTEAGFKHLMQRAAFLMFTAESLGVESAGERFHQTVGETIDAILDPATDTLSAGEAVVNALLSMDECRRALYRACIHAHGARGVWRIFVHLASVRNARQIYWTALPRKAYGLLVRLFVTRFCPKERVREIAQKMRWDAIKTHDPIRSAQLSCESEILLARRGLSS